MPSRADTREASNACTSAPSTGAQDMPCVLRTLSESSSADEFCNNNTQGISKGRPADVSNSPSVLSLSPTKLDIYRKLPDEVHHPPGIARLSAASSSTIMPSCDYACSNMPSRRSGEHALQHVSAPEPEDEEQRMKTLMSLNQWETVGACTECKCEPLSHFTPASKL